jgi:predicted transcriptional regulator
MTEKTTKKWSDEAVATLHSIVGTATPVSAELVAEAAKQLDVSERSISSKLRSLDIEVASLAKTKVSAFSDAETEALKSFVAANAGSLTYKEIADQFADAKFNNKQIQGKILALELTGSVKAAEKVEVARTYSDAEEAKFVKMVKVGSFIEEIAEALGKTLPSVRGKALSLLRSGEIDKIPAQKESHAKESGDVVESLGANIVEMTVTEIAKAANKTERGVRTLLTRRGISVKDYDGKAKREKAEGKLQALAASV